VPDPSPLERATVIASEAKQSSLAAYRQAMNLIPRLISKPFDHTTAGLLRFARNDDPSELHGALSLVEIRIGIVMAGLVPAIHAVAQEAKLMGCVARPMPSVWSAFRTAEVASRHGWPEQARP
jgi:hypothetical protein